MNQLKRKSSGGSPSPDQDRQSDAPNKRHKVDDTPGQKSDPESPTNAIESTVGKAVNDIQGDISSNGMDVEGESLQVNAQQPAEAATDSSSPRQERRLSQSRKRDRSSQSVSPHQERRSYEGRRRDSPPGRSPDQDRRTYDSRRRDASPYSSERRGSGTDKAIGDNERSRRPVVSKEEERKRGKRLFGGLLSTLSQTTSNSQQKRRQEIEKRQQEKFAKQKAEDDSRRNERLAKLDKVRKIEQVRFDEQVVSGHVQENKRGPDGEALAKLGTQMRTRHSTMLASARALQTRSEPKLVSNLTHSD